MTNKLDILLFGATGFTGKYVVLQLNRFAKNLHWGIAGRNKLKLRAVLDEATKHNVGNDFSAVPIILADVEDEVSIQNMTKAANVIINCCGPYDLYGEVVVRSCIETGTHYVDVCAEIQFINRILQKYGDAAEKKGVYIINACGYDCIPTDLGICFMVNNFSGTINTVETYMQFSEDAGRTLKATCNSGSWASLVNMIGSRRVPKIFFNKKSFERIKRPLYKPKLHMKLLSRAYNNWAWILPSADVDIVYRSQQFFYEHDNKRPIQMYNYLLIPSFTYFLILIIFSFVVGILAQFKFGRNLLLKNPEFFTTGIVTHLPSEEITNRTCFSVIFKCQGWGEKLPDAKNQFRTPPNKEITGVVSGYNPGYGFTSLAVTLCALLILKEENHLPSLAGFCTPAMAFSKTSLIQQLQDNGVVFKVLSIKDIP